MRLAGACITGRLNLRFAEIPVPIVLNECRFDEVPSLQGARIRELTLTGCALPGLAADTAQIDGRLVLTRCHLTGPLVPTRAQIHSDLDLRDTVITAPGAEAISAARLIAGGDVLCTNMAVQGAFRLPGAAISGEFDLEGASLSNPGGHALDAYHTQITEDFTFHPGFSAEGRIILSGATVAAAIGFCGARLNNADDVALEAVDVSVARNFDLGAGLTVDGGIKLDGSRIGTQLSFRDATLRNPGGMALLACGALFFGAHHPAPLEAEKAPPFNAVFYTLDLLVPITAFGQEAAFAPRDSGQWLAYALTAAGWILATTVGARISRAISRQ
ncbi:hypothetical protein OHT93_01005 [Streptomyces sp. NBC_00191]